MTQRIANTITAHVSNSVDIEIVDLSDDELLGCMEEARSRGLMLAEKREPVCNADRLRLLQIDLVINRTSEALERYLAIVVTPPSRDATHITKGKAA